jgi:hypothetical protein
VNVSDAPFPVGTPEHNEWIRKVYIPTVSHDRSRTDRSVAGAESIGGRLVRARAEPRLLRAPVRVDAMRASDASRAASLFHDAFLLYGFKVVKPENLNLLNVTC